MAANFLATVNASLASIQRHPEAYALVDPTMRRALVRRFPYAIFYEVEPNEILVYATFHGARSGADALRAPLTAAFGGTNTLSTSLGDHMEPVDSRSDARHKLIPASPADVFAAMNDPARVARWWGPAGFTNTIHKYEFSPGGSWLLTMHGPDGKDYPNESRFTRIVPDQLFEIEHLNGHHFLLTVELHPQEQGTDVMWRQTFDTVEHYRKLAEFVAAANEQNLERLAAEVLRSASPPNPSLERTANGVASR